MGLRIGGAFPFPLTDAGSGGSQVSLPSGGVFVPPSGQYLWTSGLTTQLQTFENMEKRKDRIHWVGPTLAADRLIVASTIKTALAVSPYTGDVLGEQKLSGAVSVAPSVAMGTVFIVTDDGKLVALR